MTSEEGAEAFGKALWVIGAPQIVLSTSPLDRLNLQVVPPI